MTAVPNARTSPDDTEPTTSGARRSLAAALLLGALGATLALLASRQVWAEGEAQTAGGALHQTATGSEVTGVPAALAIVGLAALVAVFAVRRSGRVLVSLLLALSGAGIVAAGLLGASDTAALDEKAASVSGDVAARIADATYSAWPYVACAGGVLLLLAGLLALRHGSRWPSMGGRYERGSGPRARSRKVDPDRPEDLWKALDRGEDPTG